MTASVKKTILANLTTQHFFFISISCSLSCLQTQTSNFFARNCTHPSPLQERTKLHLALLASWSILSVDVELTALCDTNHNRHQQHRFHDSHGIIVWMTTASTRTQSRTSSHKVSAILQVDLLYSLFKPFQTPSACCCSCHCIAVLCMAPWEIQADRAEARQASCSASSRPTVCEQEASQCGLGESL